MCVIVIFPGGEKGQVFPAKMMDQAEDSLRGCRGGVTGPSIQFNFLKMSNDWCLLGKTYPVYIIFVGLVSQAF